MYKAKKRGDILHKFEKIVGDIYLLQIPFSIVWTGVVLIKGEKAKIVGRVSSFSERFKYEIPNVKSVRIVEDPALSDDGTIVETISTRVDARISTKIGEIIQKLRAEAMKNDI